MTADVHKRIAVAATAIFVLFSLVGNGPSTYRFAVFFLAPLLWGVYLARRALCLKASHFAILGAAFVLHNLGAFGAYRKFYLGLEFDTYVHFFFGFAGGLIVAQALASLLQLHGWRLWIGTALLILGLGAIHELIEYASTLLLGSEKGMLKTNDPDQFDTQKDLANNLLGTLLALSIFALASRKAEETRSPSTNRE